MVDSSCGSTFLHKTADEAWDLFENLSDNSQQHATSSRVGLESMTQILDSHTQSIAKLETQIGQLANAISRRDEGKLPSHPIENPRASYHEQAKAVITIRNGKLLDNKVGKPIKDSESNNNETKGISMTKIERKIEKELASSSNFKTLESSPTASYKPKVTDLCSIFVITLHDLHLSTWVIVSIY
ncbi:hypothetical protein M9H77_04256 [Catharanthus roseus]|uniref:Uncharacterized protein n=1 Tax=Catharanthus roseus TaxID=4058 RepID=A0ACC0CDZ8_CATRO|nr:hypothetical protein M9H77_04256 [Catharanthus roseus]